MSNPQQGDGLTEVFNVAVPAGVAPGGKFLVEHLGRKFEMQAPMEPSTQAQQMQVRLPTAEGLHHLHVLQMRQQEEQQAEMMIRQYQQALIGQYQQQQQALMQQQQVQAIMQMQQMQSSNQEPSEWTVQQDEATGKRFYYNVRTGEARWA